MAPWTSSTSNPVTSCLAVANFTTSDVLLKLIPMVMKDSWSSPSALVTYLSIA